MEKFVRAREKLIGLLLLLFVVLAVFGLPAEAATIALDHPIVVLDATASTAADINLNLPAGADPLIFGPTALTAALDESAVPVLDFNTYLTGYDANVNLGTAKRAAVEANSTFAATAIEAVIRAKEGGFRRARDGSNVASVISEKKGIRLIPGVRPAPALKV